MTTNQQKILKQATGIHFIHGGFVDSMHYVLLDFDDPKEALAEYRDLATLFDFERWSLVIKTVLEDTLQISLAKEGEIEKVSIEKLSFDKDDLKYFIRNVPFESIVGLSVGQGRTKMTDHFGFIAKLHGYSISAFLNDQLK